MAPATLAPAFVITEKAKKYDTEADLAPVLAQLSAASSTNLRSIDLSGNSYGVDASRVLASVLRTLPALEYANLADIFTGRLKDEIPQSLDHLLPALLELKNLHTIDLSDNALGLSAITPLAAFLAKHTPLQHLILANNGFGPIAGAQVADALTALAAAKAACTPPANPLLTIVCGRNRLENGSMASWSAALAAHPYVRELRLYQNGIRQEGIEQLLMTGLANATALQTLDLQDNTFTKRGAAALAQVLPAWRAELVELGIGDCLLSARGGVLLGRALRDAGQFPKLKVLKLQYNEISASGMELIKDALSSSLQALEKLEVNGNVFSEDDPVVAAINDIFEARGLGELDDLTDLEEEDEDEEDEEEEEEEEEVEEEAEVRSLERDLEEAEAENVAEDDDEDEDDEVAAKMGSLSI
ncbi:uncharacterized protein V1518DRAFT_420627 [Limtongia smithiae]|uniref:uncharacterized protein n=1 Tax=Limtongia smithiae TaxID=1125753 RepID=UPI0034CD6E7E